MRKDRVTASQLSIKKGDTLIVTKDNGSTIMSVATSDPWKLGGHTWVIMIDYCAGCYQLSRCKKSVTKPLQSV